jgi:hypothetical protein
VRKGLKERGNHRAHPVTGQHLPWVLKA